VTFSGGAVCAPSDFVSWTNDSIYVRVPDGAQDGPVHVTVDDRDSNTQDFTVSPLAVSFTGIDPVNLYDWTDTAVPLAVTASAGIERVEVWVDGVKYGQSTDAPAFPDLVLDMAKVPNGNRNAWLQGYSANSMVTSAQAPFRVYSLRGDIDGDGQVGADDATALKPLLGAVRFQPGYEFWYDPDDDGLVTEADLSYVGYHYGEANPAP
jgi:hypothetical protein